MSDEVNHPEHYTKGDIETLDFINDRLKHGGLLANQSFFWASAIKYLDRHPHKGNPVQDLEKCKFYIDKLIKSYE